MSTPNFCNYEASKYYAIGSDASDEFIYDDTKENLYCELKSLVKDTEYGLYNYDKNKMYHQLFNRSYGGTYITSLEHEKYIGDIPITIIVHVVLSGAYYQGATLDYISEIQIDGCDYGNFADFEKHFSYKDLEDFSEMPIGMQKIQSKNVQKFVSSALPELHKQIEKIFEMYCEHTLACTAVFSNGEAIYEIAS